ncbi:MAG: Pectate lyase superfamily protein, partial [Verrucomicrobiota bacterium]
MKPIKTNPLRILAAFMAMQFYAQAVSAETNVRTLGVAGDGVQDDSPALEAALAAGQTELFFPKGIYRLT